MPATGAIIDMLIAKLRAEVLEADDINRLAGKPLEHLPFLPEELRTVEGDIFEAVANVQTNIAAHAEALQWCFAAGQLDPFIMMLVRVTEDTGLPQIDWDAEPSHQRSQWAVELCAQCHTTCLPHLAMTSAPHPLQALRNLGLASERSPSTSANLMIPPFQLHSRWVASTGGKAQDLP